MKTRQYRSRSRSRNRNKNKTRTKGISRSRNKHRNKTRRGGTNTGRKRTRSGTKEPQLGPSITLVRRVTMQDARECASKSLGKSIETTSCKMYAVYMISMYITFTGIDCGDIYKGDININTIITEWFEINKNPYNLLVEWVMDEFIYKLEGRIRILDKMGSGVVSNSFNDKHYSYNYLNAIPFYTQNTSIEPYIPTNKFVMVILYLDPLDPLNPGDQHGIYHYFIIILCGEYIYLTTSWGASRSPTNNELATESKRKRGRSEGPFEENEYEIDVIKMLPHSSNKLLLGEYRTHMQNIVTAHADSINSLQTLFGLNEEQSKFSFVGVPTSTTPRDNIKCIHVYNGIK